MTSKLPASRLPIAPLLLISPFFFWGTAMVAMKGVIPNTTPLFMAGVRLAPAGLLVLAAGILMGRPQPKGWAAWLWIALFALVDGALFQGFLAEGLTRTGAGLGSVMIDSQPIAVALMARWLFGEQIGLWGWLGLAIGIGGISLLGLPDEWILSVLQTRSLPEELQLGGNLLTNLFQNGQWLMLLAALSMAVGTVLMRPVSRHADPITATGWHMILGGLPLFLLSSQFEVGQWANLDWSNWVALSYSTVFGSAVSYGMFFYFASSGSLTSLSSLTFLTPVFALLFGNVFLAEMLSPIQWAGVGLTLVSIYLINQRDRLAQLLQKQPSLTIDAPCLPQTDSALADLTQVGVRVTEHE
ncbi:EamA family transporter [Leptolyngbya sp. FACHB-36]|uniref:DMT family transporter n=1 Tax=Leptolyngbya sp. FACHB-36 TaxID=2692808 RepID=UPI0016812FCD|nr:EamA family transporter [Leptolyngbya sp. FACHB-36]MBD2020372.1 EamA family transporter [Leptolyngbya sp. FACHB-36]